VIGADGVASGLGAGAFPGLYWLKFDEPHAGQRALSRTRDCCV
jgi:hypothetical protein